MGYDSGVHSVNAAASYSKEIDKATGITSFTSFKKEVQSGHLLCAYTEWKKSDDACTLTIHDLMPVAGATACSELSQCKDGYAKLCKNPPPPDDDTTTTNAISIYFSRAMMGMTLLIASYS